LLLANRLLFCWKTNNIEVSRIHNANVEVYLIQSNKEFSIWFDSDASSEEYYYLLDIRSGKYSFAQLTAHTTYLLSYIESHLQSSSNADVIIKPSSIISTLQQLNIDESSNYTAALTKAKTKPSTKSEVKTGPSDEAKRIIKSWYLKMRIEEVDKRHNSRLDLMKRIDQSEQVSTCLDTVVPSCCG